MQQPEYPFSSKNRQLGTIPALLNRDIVIAALSLLPIPYICHGFSGK